MSLTRRILEGARSGLSQLTSLVIVDDEPLSHVEAAALETELAARKQARTPRPGQSRIARMAGAGAAARAERARAAAERGRRVRGARTQRESAQRRAADEAFRRFKREAASGAPPPPRGSSRSSRPPRPGSHDAEVAEWYKALNLPVGADLAQVKSAYRQLMRRYHPDMHAGNPQKQRAANELSMRVTTAYNNLQAHLGKDD